MKRAVVVFRQITKPSVLQLRKLGYSLLHSTDINLKQDLGDC